MKNNVYRSMLKTFGLIGLLLCTLLTRTAVAQSLMNLANVPLFVEGSKTSLLQLVMQRDNKLFYEAYPSYEDFNGDGVLDTTYKPDEIDYLGYFESTFCYQSLGNHLEPVALASDKKCIGAWSGDFLNYATMTRMDVLLVVLYGGRRVVDTPTETRLRRAFVPWESHTWGVQYTSEAVDGYDISDYTPYAKPSAGKNHLFSTNNLFGLNSDPLNNTPWLRVRLNQTDEIWKWVDKEGVQGDGDADYDIALDVTVCKAGFLEAFCQQYPDGNFKPTGLFHEYGENDALFFSLLTGSYNNNLRGGVLRQSMGSFGTTEINPNDGTFITDNGIVGTLNKLRIPNRYRGGSHAGVQRDCGWLGTRQMRNGECRAWGNPVAEMMYEGLRYLSGSKQPTAAFSAVGEGVDLGLTSAEWDDPYDSSQPYGQCSGAYQLVISDPSPSFDGDDLPGSDFGTPFTSSTLGDLHVGNVADFISSNEPTVTGMKFVGQSGADVDRTPSPKLVTSLRNVRGLGPDEAHREGSYHASSVAYYGSTNDIHPTAEGDQTIKTMAVALGQGLPTINVDVEGNRVSFLPFARSIEGCLGVGAFKPVSAIVGFNVLSASPTQGVFRVTFEDMEQGADNDQDASVRYSYEVIDGKVRMLVESLRASTCINLHLGYVVSGTTQDGVYLVVRGNPRNEIKDTDYFQDVPPGQLPGGLWADGVPLPFVSTIDFTPSASPAAEILHSPLWYAAKWGGFDDENGDGIPQTREWDADLDGVPDNYFQITNPAEMATTLRTVFQQISELETSISSVATTSGTLRTGDRIFRSQFVSGVWSGDVFSQAIDLEGEIAEVPDWSAKDAINAQVDSGTREIFTYNPVSETGVPFQWPANPFSPTDNELSLPQLVDLSRNSINAITDGRGEDRLNYVRGETIEDFRERTDYLGDIVHSSPVLVGAPSYAYPDIWGPTAAENAKPYSEFARTHQERQRVVYIGANDGMLHALDAGEWLGSNYSTGTGSELFAFIPSPVYRNLSELTDIAYRHRPFVDATPRVADVFMNGDWRTVLIGGLGAGGQGIYALDVTEPDQIDESNADQTVLWEFTDSHDSRVGFTYSSPVIARMANQKWMAIMSNGYNNQQANVGDQSGDGSSAIIFIDIETGDPVRTLIPEDTECTLNTATANGPTEPTAVDLDGDGTVDTVYAGDLNGCVYAFDVSDSNPSQWSDGELKHLAVDDHNTPLAITAPIAVGSHPTGEGVMLYFGAGKYLEPIDQNPSTSRRRLYAVWDRGAGSSTKSLTTIANGNMLEQSITSVTNQDIDLDGDGTSDEQVQVRLTTEEAVDWSTHEGWYMNLEYDSLDAGEQIISAPLLRDGKIFVTTHIPTGDECIPRQDGWLMILDASSGAMLPNSQIDLNGDDQRNDGTFAGISGVSNAHASPTIIAAKNSDVLLTQTPSDTAVSSTTLHTVFRERRLTWRELEP